MTKITANTYQQYMITQADLPLCCPMKNRTLWNEHPRVYLPIEEKGRVTCPYCSTEYFLSELSRIDEHL